MEHATPGAMKNVTASLRPSGSKAVATKPALADWSNPDFTITIPGYYTGQFSRHSAKGAEYLAALDELKAEAKTRGYTVSEHLSNETMNTYVHFLLTGPAPVPQNSVPVLEDVVLEADEVRPRLT